MTYNTDNVIVYLGDVFENPHEERFLNRLRRDLARRRLRATVVANFVASGKNQRQIDFLILTEHRLVQVELKTLNSRAPLTGPVNGAWTQQLPNGPLHTIEPNPYRQAHHGTFAVSDVAGRLLRAGRVPGEAPFYRHIDTVLCLDPVIPPGSRFDPYAHVDVVDYNQLLDRLAAAGPRPDWTGEHWEELYRELGVYPEQESSPTARRHRNATEAVDEYAHRFVARSTDGLHELVPVAFASGPATVTDILGRIEAGRSVIMSGDSGSGKTHTAAHLAVELSRRGALVLWLRADEYDKGRFGTLVAKAAAPFSSLAATELATHAATAGRPVIVVVDGLNECPARLRPELLEQLTAFTLRYPATVLISTTDAADPPADLDADIVVFGPPDSDERRAILSSYGAEPSHVSPAFITAFELSVAARCQARLPEDATPAQLFDAYIRQLCPAETERAGLRHLAAALDRELRTSIRLHEAAHILGSRAGAGLDPPAVDAVLASRLLRASQGRVTFSHEQLGRFLTAEHLVLAATSADDLAAALAAPEHQDLRSYAVGIDTDTGRQATVLRAVADPSLYLEAIEGRFGSDAADTARAAIAGALSDAAFVTVEGSATFELVEAFFGRWQMNRPWQPAEVALLEAAGLAVRRGWFTDEVAALLDRTDVLMESAIPALRASDVKNPISAVVSAACGVFVTDPATSLAAALIMGAEPLRIGWLAPERSAVPIDRLLAGAGPRSWCRLYLACLCADHRVPSHRAVLAELLERAWAAGGYHLRLQALEMAERNGRGLDVDAAHEMRSALESLRTNHIFLQSRIVEALAACGVVTNITAEDISADIEAIISAPENEEHQQAALGLVCSMFEDEDLVGPVCTVVDDLPPGKRGLLMAMAATRPDWMFRAWALIQVLSVADEPDPALTQLRLEVFTAAAAPVTAGAFFRQENVGVHIVGVRGLARLTGRPPTTLTGPPEHAAWALMDRLIAGLEAVPVDADRVWSELSGSHAGAALEVLREMSHASMLDDDLDTLDHLIASYPHQLRQLAEWGLTHRDSLPQPVYREVADLVRYAVGLLGRVGDDASARLLEAFRSDSDLADSVVKALKEIRARS